MKGGAVMPAQIPAENVIQLASVTARHQKGARYDPANSIHSDLVSLSFIRL